MEYEIQQIGYKTNRSVQNRIVYNKNNKPIDRCGML